MERKIRGIMGVVTALLVLSATALPLTAKAGTVFNGYNYYLGRNYGESEETVAQMEEKLISDGYICISEGYEGYEPYGEHLKDQSYYWYSASITDTENYRVYAPIRELQEFWNGECGSWTVNMCSVVADYYVFHYKDDMAVSYSEDYGQNIVNTDAQTGVIGISVDVPEVFMGNGYKYDTKINVLLYGEEQGKTYNIEICGTNDYAFTDTFIIDRYTVKGAYLENSDYTVVCPTESGRLNEGQTLFFELAVTEREAYEQYIAETTNPHRKIGDTLIKDIEEQTARNPVPAIIVMVISGVLFGYGAWNIFVFLCERQNTEEECNNEFKKQWLICMALAVLIPIAYFIIRK